jgi:predicted lipoprotein with Yx(FWY)xxD motif
MSAPLRPALFAVLLVLFACGDDDSDVASDTEPATEETSEETTDAGDTADDSASDDLYGDRNTPSTSTTAAGGDALPVTTASGELGEILVDADGFTLYGFTNDTDGTPTCTDGCADTWPPLFVESGDLPEGLDPSVYSVVEHPSGQSQLKAGDWPLYRYTPDDQAGDTNGQGVGGVWFVVDPQGQLIME